MRASPECHTYSIWWLGKKSARPLGLQWGAQKRFLRCAGREAGAKQVTSRLDGGTRQRDVTRALILANATIKFKGGRVRPFAYTTLAHVARVICSARRGPSIRIVYMMPLLALTSCTTPASHPEIAVNKPPETVQSCVTQGLIARGWRGCPAVTPGPEQAAGNPLRPGP